MKKLGSGARDCIGKTIARNEMIIFVGRLIAQYEIQPWNGNHDFEIPRKFTFIYTLAEPEIPVKFVKRNHC